MVYNVLVLKSRRKCKSMKFVCIASFKIASYSTSREKIEHSNARICTAVNNR